MSRLIQRRVRSREQETESTNRRIYRRGSVDRSAVGDRQVTEIKQWPGGPRVRPGDLTAEAVEEFDGRYVAGRTLTLIRDTVQEIGHNGGDGGLVELTQAAGETVGFPSFDLPTEAPALPADGVWGVHVTLGLGAVPQGTELSVVDAATGARLWPLATSWVAGRDYVSPTLVGPLRVPHRPWPDGARPAVRVTPPSGQTVDVDYAEVTWGIEGQQAVSDRLLIVGYSVRYWGDGAVLGAYRLNNDGTDIELQTTSAPGKDDAWRWMRARIDGGRIRARLWSGSEPSSWPIDVSDPGDVVPKTGFGGVAMALPSTTDALARHVDVFEVSLDGGPWASTDFSEYPTGSPPADWESMAQIGSQRWVVRAGSSGAAGNELRWEGGEGNGEWPVWVTPGKGASMEVLARIKSTGIGNGSASIGVILRGNPEVGP